MGKLSDTVFIAEGAAILGDVEIGDKTSVWYNAVIRGDVVKVKIGEECNVQDCCVIHGEEPVVLGNRVSLGHGAIVHGAKIGDNVLVGMGSVIMDGAEIGENSLVAAGALITKGKKFPPNSLIMGSPAVAKRELKPEELESVSFNADLYLATAKKHREGLWDTPIDDLIAEIQNARKWRRPELSALW